VTITEIQDSGGIANNGNDTTSLSIAANVTVVPVNDPPVLTATAGTTAATEQTAIAIDSGITVGDPDNTTLASATVQITGNFQSAEDLLAFANDNMTMGNISGVYDSGTGKLTLSSTGATATLTQWQAALAVVTYT